MKKTYKIKVPTLLEKLAHSSSEVAKAAFRTGNASGVHEKDKGKQARIKNKQEERKAQQGDRPTE